MGLVRHRLHRLSRRSLTHWGRRRWSRVGRRRLPGGLWSDQVDELGVGRWGRFILVDILLVVEEEATETGDLREDGGVGVEDGLHGLWGHECWYGW